jgi:hypothetical protein
MRPSRSSSAALADAEQVLGQTHIDTVAIRISLASAYRAAGRLDEAFPLIERTIADAEQIRGQIDPRTLTSRYNIAPAYQLDDAAADGEQSSREAETESLPPDP